MVSPLPALTSLIEALGQEWLNSGAARSLAHINSGEAPGGNCNTFAHDVAQAAIAAGWPPDAVQDVELAMFQMADPDDTPGRPLDRDLLARHWPKVVPPEGMGWDRLQRLAEDAGWSTGTHVWLLHGDRHYDAECPQGVDSFLDLPFFERAIRAWLQEQGQTSTPPRRRLQR